MTIGDLKKMTEKLSVDTKVYLTVGDPTAVVNPNLYRCSVTYSGKIGLETGSRETYTLSDIFENQDNVDLSIEHDDDCWEYNVKAVISDLGVLFYY
jgi:hypothetical protein